MLKGIIFDMDGTITMTETIHHRAFAEVFREFGVDYSLEEHVAKYVGSGAENIFHKVFLDRKISQSHEKEEEAVAKKRKLYTKFIQEEEIPLVEGAKEFIQKIHGFGLKKIIATGNSYPEPVRIILNRVGLNEYFPDIVCVSEVKNGKPAPDVFIEALRRLGISAAQCLVLEDAANGVLAAKTAGIRCIAFETTAPREALLNSGAVAVLKNYHELTDVLLYG